jgi:hypothetical protein
MKESNQNVLELHNKKIYVKRTKKGWSIVIMPDKILIDNFHHGYTHIHPQRQEIKTGTLNDTLLVVLKHINYYEGVELEQLLKDLIK